jgi:hypothetical protein
MRDDKDHTLVRLFAEQDQSLPPDDFVLRLARRIDDQQQARGIYRNLAVTACLVLSLLSAPWFAELASDLAGLTAAGISSIAPLLYMPLTWMVVSATMAGFSPVLYLWWTGRW